MGLSFNEIARVGQLIEADTNSIIIYAEQLIRSDNACLFLASLDGEIVGMAGALLYPFHANLNVLIAQETVWWVEPEFRGHGAGPELQEALERWAEANGARFMIMSSQPNLDGDKVNRHLTRVGYQPIDQNHIREIGRRH
jgi:GNAT superfamily N-acetyltransferase